MTQQEKNALLARFKSCTIPTEQDFAALIDAIDAAASAASVTPASPIELIRLNDYTHDQMVQDLDGFSGGAYEITTVEDIIAWWEGVKQTQVTSNIVIISNQGWENSSQNAVDQHTIYIATGTSSGGPDEILGVTALGIYASAIFVKVEDPFFADAYNWVVVDRGTPIDLEALSDLRSN